MGGSQCVLPPASSDTAELLALGLVPSNLYLPKHPK